MILPAPEIISPEDIVFEATSIYENLVPLEEPTVNDVQNVTISTNAPLSFSLWRINNNLVC